MPISSSLKKLPDNTIKVLATIGLDEISGEYEQVLTQLQKVTEVAGFRKGKAPKEQVEKIVGKEKIYDKVIKNLVPKIYAQIIKTHQLRPIVNPKIKLIAAKEGEDWQIEFTLCETPVIDLDHYKEEIKKITVKDKIWTPAKGQQPSKQDESKRKAEEAQKIIQALLKHTKITIPAILIEDEVNRKLSSLIEKTEKLGLTLDQYLNSLGKTAQQIKEEYRKESQDNWHLELALNKIADEEKIVVDQSEVDQFIEKAKDEKEKKGLAGQRYVLASILRRQKTLEFLQSL